MKKLILVALLAGVTFMTYAQQQLNAGFKAGINLSQIRFSLDSDSETTDMGVGFQLGAYFNFPVSESVSIQPELLFNRVGGKQSEYDEDLGEEITAAYKLDYISVPLMFKFKVAENFNLQAGPQVGFLTNAKVKVEFQGQSVEVGAKELFESIDFGFNAGFGLTFNKLAVDARYLIGIANIAKDSGDMKANNRVIQLSLSYKLTKD